MQYAILNNERIEAIPNTEAICPICQSVVISKCGSIMVWHWAHQSKEDCDSWYEPESKWHRDWKEYFRPEEREVVIGKHRADIKVGKTIIELQHSSISAINIKEREGFYNNMIWIINGKDFKDNFITWEKEGYYSFKWKHPRKCWSFSNKPKYIDFGTDFLFEIKKIYPGSRCCGWGKQIYKEDFLTDFNVLVGL
jgi:competence CoiA-like predicted nuclease